MQRSCESAFSNLLGFVGAVVTGMNLIAILYVIAAGLPFARASNLAPFMPFGVRGIFSASSVVFFAFVGFDSLAACAEEVRAWAPQPQGGLSGFLTIC
jgi:APA family basic amino acid/polyamine antiporter